MAHLDRTKLAKFLGMVGSDHDGEATAAARMAHKLVKAAGLTWDEVINPVAAEPKIVFVDRPAASPGGRALVLSILSSSYAPDAKEGEFLRDMLGRRGSYTPAQTRWLKIIAVKAGVL